jgi:hypothetical protein
LSDKDKIETGLDFKSESFKKYFKNTSWRMTEKILRMVVGQYAAAFRLSEDWYFIPMGIAVSLFPVIINAKIQSEKLYYVRL